MAVRSCGFGGWKHGGGGGGGVGGRPLTDLEATVEP